MSDITQLIGAAIGGGVITGLFTMLGTYLTNKQKVQELKIQYQLKLEDSYREQAQLYVDSLYKPLNKIIYRLYVSYSACVDEEVNSKEFEPNKITTIQTIFTDFFTETSALLNEGDSGYLTPSLDIGLHQFISFLRQSLHTDKLSEEYAWLSFSDRPPFTILQRIVLSPATRQEWAGYQDYVFYAPIGSSPFNKRFFDEVSLLQTLIREVMLHNKIRHGGV